MDVYKNALNQCTVDLHSKLDLQPYLLHQNMLTNVESSQSTMLTNAITTRYKKINDLIALLPRKGPDWWKNYQKFEELSSGNCT